MPSDKEIKPCPFCGEPGLIGRGMHGGWFIQCVQCSMLRRVHTRKEQKRERAVMLWNSRKGEQKDRQELLKKLSKTVEKLKRTPFWGGGDCRIAFDKVLSKIEELKNEKVNENGK